jgi:hypothetical protein
MRLIFAIIVVLLSVHMSRVQSATISVLDEYPPSTSCTHYKGVLGGFFGLFIPQCDPFTVTLEPCKPCVGFFSCVFVDIRDFFIGKQCSNSVDGKTDAIPSEKNDVFGSGSGSGSGYGSGSGDFDTFKNEIDAVEINIGKATSIDFPIMGSQQQTNGPILQQFQEEMEQERIRNVNSWFNTGPK